MLTRRHGLSLLTSSLLATPALATPALATTPPGHPTESKPRMDSTIFEAPAGPIEVWREGEGPTLLLLPSLGRGQEDFDALVPRLVAAGLRVLRPEPRGIGRSAPLRPGATLHDMAADLAALLRAEASGPAFVAGHAAGNWTARVLAHDAPELVGRIALLAAVTGTAIDPEIRRSITASFSPELSDGERLAHLRRAYFAPGNDAAVWLPGWYPAVAQAQRAAAAATTDQAWLRAAERHPLLYVAAAQDAIAAPPSEAELRASLGPRVTRVVVENAGHALLPEQPEAVAAALIGFARAQG
ncbi:alpha/beta hydrolase [Roseomonas sp. GC11]|uniref:alpha/beta fold hydrolase n=1 Tax=Roseomonas sp. GC11 TaxID=2950546 RepID=UPI00210CF4C8|nr:alpha/beta hydrolase [Roseomonas sp. GC11]MCQ4160007.1 alpha/beta hydrolase [Roseomonas sp. GC11]